MTEDSQRYIACFETLAQQALLECMAQLVRGSSTTVTYKQDCDNSPTEGPTNRLFSSKVPLKYFIQALAGLLAGGRQRVGGRPRPRLPRCSGYLLPSRRVRLPPGVLARTRTGQRVFPEGSSFTT